MQANVGTVEKSLSYNVEVSQTQTNRNRLNSMIASNKHEQNFLSDLNATFMVIIMCLSTVLVHAITLLINSYFVFNLTHVFVYRFLGNFSLSVKCVLDFLVFFKFNKNFRRLCLSYLGIYYQAHNSIIRKGLSSSGPSRVNKVYAYTE